MPVEQPRPEALFQRVDPAHQRGMVYAKAPRGGGKAAAIGDGGDKSYVVPIP